MRTRRIPVRIRSDLCRRGRRIPSSRGDTVTDEVQSGVVGVEKNESHFTPARSAGEGQKVDSRRDCTHDQAQILRVLMSRE